MRCALTAIILLSLTAYAGASGYIFNDDFSTLSNWNNLSLAVGWGGYSTPTSCFTTSADGAGKVGLTSTALNYTGYTSTSSLKTFDCLDKQFAAAVDHTKDILVINFSAKWSGTSADLDAEGSRLVVSVNYDYPAGGLVMTRNDKYNKFDKQWWARPAYNMRIRTLGKECLLIYGGDNGDGADKMNGHYEEYIYRGTPRWWLPGFSAADALSPYNSPEVGINGCAGAGKFRYSQTQYMNYRYVVTQSQQQLWYDTNNDGTLELIGTQNLAGVDGTGIDAMGYRCNFPSLEGVRIYWQGGSSANPMLDSFSAEVLLPGDSNFDHQVDVVDLGILATNYGALSGVSVQNGDFNGDGTVDVVDLGLLATSYGQSYSAGDIVPEPASLALLMFGGLMANRRKRD
jgi:hypothetical protein